MKGIGGRSSISVPKHVARQFLAYSAIGGMAFLADFTALYLLTDHFHLHYLISASASFLLGLIVNYLLCIGCVFKYRAIANNLHEFTLFSVIGLVGLILNNALLYVLTDGAGLHYLFSKAIAAGGVLVFNFSARRHFLFSNNAYARRFGRGPGNSRKHNGQ